MAVHKVNRKELKLNIAKELLGLSPTEPALPSGQLISPHLLANSHTLSELRAFLRKMRESNANTQS